MFRLTESEAEIMVSQNVIRSKQSLGGLLQLFFTEHGVLLLANVIKSERATQMSIKIIEIFVNMIEYLNNNVNLKLDIESNKKES